MVIFLMLGLGLALVGTLSRDVMKIAAARRERVSARSGVSDTPSAAAHRTAAGSSVTP